MDITFLGQSAFKIKGKAATVVTDPYESSGGEKFPKLEADIVTLSYRDADKSTFEQISGDPIVLTGPGEYEIKEIKVVGGASFHDEKQGKVRGKNTIYNISVDGVNVCHLGDLGQAQLSTEQMEAIGGVDILLIPTGGVDTIDAGVAAKITAELEPKIVIPMHFSEEAGAEKLEPVEKFVKEMGAERAQPMPKLSIKEAKLPEELTFILLNKVN